MNNSHAQCNKEKTANNKSKSKILSLVILTSLIALAIALAVLFSASSIDNQSVQLWLNQHLPEGFYGVALFIFMSSVAMAIGLPRQFVALCAGYILDTLMGTFIATISATIACLLTIAISKYLFRNKVLEAFPQPLKTVNQFFSQHTFAKAFIIRLLPAGSNFLTNVLAGLANINTRYYVAGSCLGFLPQMYIFSLLGSGIRLEQQQQIWISLALFMIAILLGVLIYRNERLAMKLD